MKSADLRDRHDAPARSRLYFARMGAVVVEGLMRAGGVVVREVTAQQASEVPFVEHDDVIEAFWSNRPDDALGEGILPGRSRRDEDLANSQTLHPPCEHVAVDGIPIAEQVLRRRLFWEALDQLVGGPGRGWVVGDVDVNELPAIVAEHDEREEQAESEGGNDKEIDPDNLPEMRLQEGAPGGRGARRCAAHVLGDRQFGGVIAKEVEFGLDASPGPRRGLVGQ